MEEIFQEYLSSSKDELKEAARKLKNMTPSPMNTMLQKQPKQEAIEKRIQRAKMVAEDVPPTTPGKLLFIFFFTVNDKKMLIGKHDMPLGNYISIL